MRLEREPSLNYGVAGRIVTAIAIIALLILGCGGWAGTAELEGAVIAQGQVIVDQRVKKVQHRDGGIVAELKVHSGQRVAKSELLIRLDDTQTRAELGIIQSQLVELRGRLARVRAESSDEATINFPDVLKSDPAAVQVIAGEIRLFNDNRRNREGQIQQLEERIGQLKQEDSGVRSQRSAKERELALIRKELDVVQDLQRRNLTPMQRVYSLQRDETRIDGEHGNLVAQSARINGQVNELRMQILTLGQQARTDAQKDLRQVEGRIAELVERQVAAQDRLTRVDIRAPIDGVVHELSAFTVGGVITPAEPIMLIVPEGQALSVELRVAPTDIDQVYIDQTARLRFTSFNQRLTPEIEGVVSLVSADISRDSKGRGSDYYTATIRLSDDATFAVGGRPVMPGMPVEAHLTTQKRTALSYLTKPIVDQFAKTFRER